MPIVAVSGTYAMLEGKVLRPFEEFSFALLIHSYFVACVAGQRMRTERRNVGIGWSLYFHLCLGYLAVTTLEVLMFSNCNQMVK